MASLNMQSIKVRVAKGVASDHVCQRAAESRAKTVFEDAVLGLQKEFEDSKITQEIDGGIASKNISETLRGGEAPENLFSFIGFDEGTYPTDEIRKRLDPDHKDGPKFKYSGKLKSDDLQYKFTISAPDKNAIYSATPLPWAEGMSWAQKIERSIPGFTKFLPKFMTSKNSRSGGGIQVKSDLRGARFIPPKDKYLSGMISNFINRIKSYNTRGFKKRF